MVPAPIALALVVGAVAFLANNFATPSPSRVSQSMRIRVFERDGGQCVYCTVPVAFERVHIDHSVSKINGGTLTMRNLRTSCSKCNLKKGKKNGREFRQQLAREQRVASGGLRSRKRVKKPSTNPCLRSTGSRLQQRWAALKDL
jgi:hypothetical protein